jgi:hypothetical protein
MSVVFYKFAEYLKDVSYSGGDFQTSPLGYKVVYNFTKTN